MYVDVVVKRSAKYRMALYFVDWDCIGRQTAVEVFDLHSLNRSVQDKLVSDYAQGKYLVYKCEQSVRIRIDLVRGDNTVLSGIFFDPVGG